MTLRALIIAAFVAAALSTAAIAREPDASTRLLADRLFPLLPTLAKTPRLIARLDTSKVASDRADRITAAIGCTPAPDCVATAHRWSAADIDAVAKLMPPANADAWRDTATAMNQIIAVYATGGAQRYPKIDAPAFAAGTRELATLVTSLSATLDDARTPPTLFARPLAFVTGLLHIHDREEAIAFEPLDIRENGSAIARIRTIDWSRYRYTALVVLGDGPERADQRLGAFGKLRLMAAARRWHDGLAPVIIVTGGNVHPAWTSINEAIEMRRMLVERHGVSADAVVIEPYARHTTTNLRNAARLMHRYGIPLDRDALIVTSESQSAYVTSPVFATRCIEELGYAPAMLGQRISPFDVVFRASVASLKIDSRDPLDP